MRTSSGRSATSPTSTRSAPTSRRASSATPSTGPATGSPTGSSTTPSPTRPWSCPTILVDQEVEVMHDEFRRTLARQGITEEAYLKAVDKTEADLHAEFRPGAEKRVRTLLVLSKVADDGGGHGPRRRGRGRDRPRSRALPGRAAAAGVLRLGPRSELHPQHAPPQPGRRAAHRRVAGRAPRARSRCRISRRCPASTHDHDHDRERDHDHDDSAGAPTNAVQSPPADHRVPRHR